MDHGSGNARHVSSTSTTPTTRGYTTPTTRGYDHTRSVLTKIIIHSFIFPSPLSTIYQLSPIILNNPPSSSSRHNQWQSNVERVELFPRAHRIGDFSGSCHRNPGIQARIVLTLHSPWDMHYPEYQPHLRIFPSSTVFVSRNITILAAASFSTLLLLSSVSTVSLAAALQCQHSH